MIMKQNNMITKYLEVIRYILSTISVMLIRSTGQLFGACQQLVKELTRLIEYTFVIVLIDKVFLALLDLGIG